LTGFSNSTRTYFQIRRLIKNENPKVIHLSSSSSLALIKDFSIISFARRFNIPVVMHWHFGRIPTLSVQKNWEWKLLSSIIRKSAFSIVIDNKSYKTLISAGFANVQNIPNPIDLDFEQNAKTFSEKIHTRVQGRIIFVGHIIKDKGVYELVEACTHLTEIKELLLIGPYEEDVKKELFKIADKRSNGVWLRFKGPLVKDHVLQQMRNSPILVLPSYTEGFPMVVIEAMAMGCAVIATDVGAIPEMLAVSTKTPCGICVPVQDIEKLKEAVLSLVKDPNKAELMGKMGIKRVLNHFTLDIVMNQYKSVWENAAIN
jgi:glycosyltransferase involved in cell wall biosynthesis